MTKPYAVGTVSVSTGDTVVVGNGGPEWIANARSLDWLTITGFGPVKIRSIVDSTHLEISEWPYADVAAGAYIIDNDGLNSFAAPSIAQNIVDLVEDLDADGFFIFVKSTDTVPNPRKGDDGQYARQPSTGKEWYKDSGVWVYQGISGAVTFDAVPYSSATTYAARTLVSFGGTLYLSLQSVNLNHLPSTSPSWWQRIIAGGDTVYIAMDDSDRPASGETVLKFISPKAMTVYAGMIDSYANASTGATLSAVYSLKKNGTQFASITFAAAGQAGAQSGTFVCAADTTFAAGDILTIVAPNPRDGTLSTVGITLTAYR
jgi:hypothetical protein